MHLQLENIKKVAFALINEAETEDSIQDIKVRFLGKKGEITLLMKELGSLSKEDRPAAGQLINSLRDEIEQKVEVKFLELKEKSQQNRLQLEKLDVTLPGRKSFLGSKHPVTLVIEEITEIFNGLGFTVA